MSKKTETFELITSLITDHTASCKTQIMVYDFSYKLH